MISELERIEKAAMKGPWLSTRVEPKSATDSYNEPYSPWMIGRGPRAVTVGRGTYIHADDMALICALRNAAPALIAVAKKAESFRMVYDDVSPDQGEVFDAIADLRYALHRLKEEYLDEGKLTLDTMKEVK